ncbi:TonB-dependent siderophore receptor [Rhizobium sp. CRIBSB]|nr:TonB-dependent siderophore receptor [Rhizobium sp. CRIBSB]
MPPLSPAALRALLFASSAAGMLCSAPALASDPSSDAVFDPDQETQVAGVEVNARRHPEPVSPEHVAPLLDTPRAITVIPQAIIEQTAATSLQDLLRTSPGITFGAGEGGQPLADRPFIRGQASGNNVFVDGIRDSGGQQREVFNLEQVEVIKGPDAVYSGRGSGGGSINLSSKSPQLTNATNAGFGLGTDHYLRGTIDQNWRLGETAGLRINLMGSSGDIAGRDSVDFDRWGAALSLAAGLGTGTTGTFSYYHLTSEQMPDYGIPLFTKIGIRTTDSGILDVPYDAFYGLKARDYLINEVDTFTGAFEHRVSEALSIRNVTRYSETLNDYVVTNPGDGGTITTNGVALIGGEYWMKRGTKSRWNPTTTTANVTDLFGSVATGILTHSYDIGLELAREENRNASYVVTTTGGSACPAPLTGFDCTRLYDPDPGDPWTGTIVRGVVTTNTTDSIGLYAFDSIAIGTQWRVNLGLRYDDYSVDGFTSAGVITPEASWEFVNWQAGLVFKPTASSSLYVSASTASTPPTISAGDQNTAVGTGTGNLLTVLLEPEETTSFELGAKANVFDDRVALSAALFHLTRQNAQIQVSPGVYAQAGEARVQGLELGVSGHVTPAWQVFGGYTWMDSELTRGAYNTVNVGDPLANTPEHSFSLFTTYRVTRPLTVGGGVYHVSDSFGGNQGGAGGGANRIHAPAYTRIDLFAALDLTERTALQLNVQNAGDAAYVIRTNGVHHADVAPARSASLTLNVRF